MSKESFLAICSSLVVYFSYFELGERIGFVLFHIILLYLDLMNSLQYPSGPASFLEFRPGSKTGFDLGSLLVPMVLTSQITLLKRETVESNRYLSDVLEYYLLASQLISMQVLLIACLPLYKTRRFFSWFPVLFMISICIAATVNDQLGSSKASPSYLIIVFFPLLLFVVWLFPRSFSLGEAMVLVQACLFLVADSWLCIGNRLHYVIPSAPFPTETISRSLYTYWLQILVVGSLSIGLFLLPVFYYINIVRNTLELWIGSISFYIVMFLVFLSFLLPWSLLMLGGVNPLTWVINHITLSSTRINLIIYWSCTVLFSVAVVAWRNYSSKTSLSRTIARKIFHLSAVVIFVPGIICEPKLTHLAASAAVAVFIILEYVRISRVAPLGEALHQSLQVFLDEKDTGRVILSHIYLLVGCAAPLWLYPGDLTDINNGCLIAVYSGVLSLGVGDTIASVVGKRFGCHKWTGNSKTLEGTAAGIIAQIICVIILSQTGLIYISRWIPTTLAVVVTSLLEAWTSQIDNLVLPPFLFSLLLPTCH